MQFEENIRVSLNGLYDHKLRSFLTMLGIIFGVASVIAMLSIGEGAKREAIAKYKDLGVNNIIIRDKDLSRKQLEQMRAKFSSGLSLLDAKAIKDVVPGVVEIAAQAEKKVSVAFSDKSARSTLIGITPSYIHILNQKISDGEFITNTHYNKNMKVCVVGAGIVTKLFPGVNPIGRQIKVEDQWLEIVGLLESKTLFTETVGELAARDLNNDVYVPLSTFNKRFQRDFMESELKQITVQLKEGTALNKSAEIVRRIVNRHHYENDDYSIIIPLELMKQEEKERRIFNILLGAIAAISLLVGGIGIMNIMLATVMERTREIGIRRAIGAKRQDIMSQFVTEAVVLSITGGIIGVILGVTFALLISFFTDVNTAIRLYSVFVAFGFSVLVGVSFGYLPAKNAANLNPIESIRYE